jgi:tetratricopeptide (TPR) repeat protein
VLSEEIGGDERLLNVLYGQFVNAFNRPKLHDAERYAAEFMAIGERRDSEAAVLVAHQLTGMAAFLLGDLERSRGHLEDSLRVGGVDPALLKQYSHGWHPNSALNYLSWNLFALGYPEQARARARESVAISKGKSDLQYVSVLCNGCYLHQMAGDYTAVEANLAVLLDVAERKGIVVFYEVGRVFKGWTEAGRGDFSGAITLICDALAALTATEQAVEHPYLLSILADTYLRAGRLLDAQKQLESALAMVEATEERWYAAELHRLTGEVALVQGNTAEAEMQFQKAIGVARAQSARMWELRAAKRLACLWREAGKPAAAFELLVPVLHGFTEGFDTSDVIEGKALLRELG